MRSMAAILLFLAATIAALQGSAHAQSINPNQARADAELKRQRAESLVVQKKNELTDKDERAQYEARKKGYEKDERRREDRLKQEALAREKAMQKSGQGEGQADR